MSKLYLILIDEPLNRRNIMLVDNEEQAKALVKNDSYYIGYDVIETLSDEDVKEIVCDNRLSTVDYASEFYDAHCVDCDVKYMEECPYL